MDKYITWALSKFKVDFRLVILYIVVYLLWGTMMNWVGEELRIAKFTYWWQVITVYVLYMVPISLLLRGLPIHGQYAYGLIAMGLLEFSGYALESSYAYPGNPIDHFFTVRNFSLAMALFFAWYFPLGNWAVGSLYGVFFSGKKVDS